MKKFLAISGGGDRGCVVVGALLELCRYEGNVSADWEELAGISVGGLIAATLSQSDKNGSVEQLEMLKKEFFSKNFHVVDSWAWGGTIVNALDALMYHNSIYQSKPLERMIERWYNDKKVARPFYVGAYNKTLCRYETFNSNDCKSMSHPILASASVPIILPDVKIDSFMYEDGGVRHLIPVNEIRKWVSKTDGEKHVDVLVCYPVNNFKHFMKTLVPKTEYSLINNSVRTVADMMLLTMQNDLLQIAKMLDKSLEEITASNCGAYTNGDLTIRIMSPKDGNYSDFTQMNIKSVRDMFDSGTKSVREYLNAKK